MTVSAASLMTRISENWPKFARQVLQQFDRKLDNTGDTPASGTYDFSGCTVFEPSNAQTVFGSAGTGAAMLKEAGNINRQVSIAGAGNGADTTEDTLFTFTIPANAFDTLGRGVMVSAFGTTGTSAHTKTVRMYFGTGVSFTLAIGTIASSAWNMQLQVYKGSAVNTQIAQGQNILGGTHQGITAPLSGTEPENAGIVVKVTGQVGTGAVASEVTANLFEVEAFN
ncbi:MAG TPA: hypothetical protein VF957_23455 [Bradyrhizobium sp.]